MRIFSINLLKDFVQLFLKMIFFINFEKFILLINFVLKTCLRAILLLLLNHTKHNEFSYTTWFCAIHFTTDLKRNNEKIFSLKKEEKKCVVYPQEDFLFEIHHTPLKVFK
jgi:hypothetical protein